MGYLGQKYDKGLVIQRSEEGSAFQENVDVTVDGDTEVTPKVSGGIKKVNITGGGGTEVIPNPELEGDEAHLASLEIDGTVYDLDGKTYDKNNIVNMATIDYDTAANRAHVEITAEAPESEAIAAAGAIENRIGGTFTSAEAYLSVTISDEEMSAVKAGFEIDAETGDSRTYVEINADEVNINGEPYSTADSTLEFDTVTDLYSYLTSNNVSYCPIMISNIGNVERFTRLGVLDSSTPQVIGIDDITDILTYFGNEARIYQKTFNTKSHLCIVIGETREF